MGYINAILILGGINIIAALGVSILTGYTGLFTIGHAGFMALGGYTSAILVKEARMPVVLALICGGIFFQTITIGNSLQMARVPVAPLRLKKQKSHEEHLCVSPWLFLIFLF